MNAQSEAKSLRVPLRGRAAAALALLSGLGLSPALYEPAAAADWVVGAKSQARLIDGGFRDGARYAGAQVRLSGDAVTYWRDPGEAGVPPTFDFAGSDNVAEAEAVYPQPERIDEEGQQAFGYRHEVLFPIRVAPLDPKKPISLVLKLDYAVCDKICIPAHAQMSLILPPEPQTPETALLDGALKQVPRILDGDSAAGFAAVDAGSARGRQSAMAAVDPGRRGARPVRRAAGRLLFRREAGSGEKQLPADAGAASRQEDPARGAAARDDFRPRPGGIRRRPAAKKLNRISPENVPTGFHQPSSLRRRPA